MSNNLKKFLKQVEDNTCTENMVVDLQPGANGCGTICTGPFFKCSANDIKLLAKALASGNCKPGLIIDLRSNYIGNNGAKALAEALLSPNRPAKLWLDLTGNNMTDDGLNSLMDAILAGPTTPGLRLDLDGRYAIRNGCGCGFGDNKFTDTGASNFAQTLEKLIVNGKCPQDLYFNLMYTNIDDMGATAIAEALEAAITKSSAKQTISLDLPSTISQGLLYRIQKDLETLNNRNNNPGYSPTFYAPKANTSKSDQPAPSLSARI